MKKSLKLFEKSREPSQDSSDLSLRGQAVSGGCIHLAWEAMKTSKESSSIRQLISIFG